MTILVGAAGTPSVSQQSSQNWIAELRPFRKAALGRATYELLITAIPFIACLAGSAAALVSGWMSAYFLLALAAAGLLVRLFMIQHDCGHDSFFPSHRANVWTGRIIGVFTMTPFDLWRKAHAFHHAGAGNLDRRGVGDIDTLTVAEYEARSAWGRLAYRLYRHPLVMFVLGPTYVFVIQNRIPLGFMRDGAMPWLSTMGTNLGILALAVAGTILIGPMNFVLAVAPVIILAATAGVWLFYVQHQFEDTYWSTSEGWNAQDAALFGSSHYDLPQPLLWLSANIGLHHIHHMASRVPFYRLQEVLDTYPQLRSIRQIKVRESFATVRLALWDEADHQLISFAKHKARRNREI